MSRSHGLLSHGCFRVVLVSKEVDMSEGYGVVLPADLLCSFQVLEKTLPSLVAEWHDDFISVYQTYVLRNINGAG